MTDDVTPKHPHLSVSFTNGPVHAPADARVEFYDPMRANARQNTVDMSIYRGNAQDAALRRRTGFPSYLTQPTVKP